MMAQVMYESEQPHRRRAPVKVGPEQPPERAASGAMSSVSFDAGLLTAEDQRWFADSLAEPMDPRAFLEARAALGDVEELRRDLAALAMVRLRALMAWEGLHGVPSAVVSQAFDVVQRLLEAFPAKR